jgi:parallel beta-helix repeat protein
MLGLKTLSLDSNVTIENNIIQNNAIGVYLNYAYESSWNIVRDNIIVHNVRGIYAHWADNGEIAGNTITMNDDCGLEMQHCKTCSITGNILSDNGYGIYLRGASNQNTIKGKNRIQDNAIGVKISESHGKHHQQERFHREPPACVFLPIFFHHLAEELLG